MWTANMPRRSGLESLCCNECSKATIIYPSGLELLKLLALRSNKLFAHELHRISKQRLHSIRIQTIILSLILGGGDSAILG